MTDTDNKQTTEPDSTQPVEDRASNRSQRPSSRAFKDFMGSSWDTRTPANTSPAPAAAHLPRRHTELRDRFPGERLVIPAGDLKVRTGDADHRFRAHSAFIHLTGLQGEAEPNAVLVVEPVTPDSPQGEAVLYFTPRASRTSEEFYADARHGEFWVGARPSLEEMEQVTGLTCRPSSALEGDLAAGGHLRVLPGIDGAVDALVASARDQETNQTGDLDAALVEAVAELRLVKDDYELEQMEQAVAATKRGFEAVIAALPKALNHPRGERVLEGAFAQVAREDGNGVAFDTIAASGNNANTLHWTANTGTVLPGDLVLVDAGVELDSLYNGDLTRTLPANGKFTDAQKKVYNAVLEAAEAALAAAVPGATYSDMHAAAMEVLATNLEAWGVLPVPAAEALSPEGQQHRRWMPHGTGHHLGLDVHDCAESRYENYQGATLAPGMVFTIEPGLYFREDDLAVPEELRGIGVRIEDNIVIEPDGRPRRISEDVPRTVEDVEAWLAEIQDA